MQALSYKWEHAKWIEYNLATLIPYHMDCAELRSGPASATVPDLPSSKSPSRHRSHPWSLAWPPCSLEEWQCSWQSHFGSSNCSTSRRPAPTAPPEGGSLNGPWITEARQNRNKHRSCWVLNSNIYIMDESFVEVTQWPWTFSHH